MEVAEWRDDILCRNCRWALWSSEGQSLGCGHEAHDRYDRYRYYNSSSPILVFHEIFSFPCRGLLLGLDDSPHAGMGADDGLDLDLVLFQLCRYLPMPHTWLSSHQSFTEEDESERSPAKSDPFEGEQLPFPFAPERACFRKVGRCRSLQQRQPPPGSCLAVQPSPQSGRCGWCRHQTGQNESCPTRQPLVKSVHATSWIRPRMLWQSQKKVQ